MTGEINYEQLTLDAIASASRQITPIAMDEVINNINKYDYDQKLQNIAKLNDMDPLLMLSVAAVESLGDAGKEGGMFNSKKNVDLGTVSAQITNFCNEYIECKNKIKLIGDNPLPICQVYYGWNGINKYRHKIKNNNNGIISYSYIERTIDLETAVYSVDWVEMVYNATGSMSAIEYFPKIYFAYQILQTKVEALSSLTTKTGDGYEFPIKTIDLMFTYFVQDYGVTNVGGGVTVVSRSCLFRTENGTPVISAHDGTVTEIGENNELGKFLKIKCAHDNGTVVYGRLKIISVSQGCSVSKGAVVASTTDGLALQFIDHQGQYRDPKTQWPLLSGRLDEKTSLGKQIENTSI